MHYVKIVSFAKNVFLERVFIGYFLAESFALKHNA